MKSIFLHGNCLLTVLLYCCLSWPLVAIKGEDFFDNPCGTLYSRRSFLGDTFILRDFDQSGNTGRDFRSATANGWESTKSIRLQRSCSMYICSEIHFQGKCKQIKGDMDEADLPFQNIHSANCTCASARTCKCEEVSLDKFVNKLYKNGGCNTCDAATIHQFTNKKLNDSLVLRSGCTAKFLSGDVASTSVVFKNQFDKFQLDANGNLVLHCGKDDTAENQKAAIVDREYVKLPSNDAEALELLSANCTSDLHPGIVAALTSFKKGRSYKSASILILGTWAYLGWNENLAYCTDCTSSEETICECRIPVVVEQHGISDVTLRVIAAYHLGKKEQNDSIWLATLNEYLSKDADLKESILTAVIVTHDVDGSLSTEDNSTIHRRLQALSVLQPHYVDEDFSNVIFIPFGGNYSIHKKENSEKWIVEYDKIIKETLSLSSSPHIIFYYHHFNTLNYVYDNRKIQNGEFYPKNVFEKIKLVCEKAEDPFGRLVIVGGLQSGGAIVKNVTIIRKPMVSGNHALVTYYNQRLSNTLLAGKRLKGSRNFCKRNFMEKLFINKIDRLESELEKGKTEILDLKNKLGETVENIKAEVLKAVKEDLGKLFE